MIGSDKKSVHVFIEQVEDFLVKGTPVAAAVVAAICPSLGHRPRPRCRLQLRLIDPQRGFSKHCLFLFIDLGFWFANEIWWLFYARGPWNENIEIEGNESTKIKPRTEDN